MLDEGIAVFHLRRRFERQRLWTHFGDALSLAMNPMSRSEPKRDAAQPGIAALTAQCHAELLRSGQRQSVLLVGASGAGKTANRQRLLQHLLSAHSEGAICGCKFELCLLEAQRRSWHALESVRGESKFDAATSPSFRELAERLRKLKFAEREIAEIGAILRSVAQLDALSVDDKDADARVLSEICALLGIADGDEEPFRAMLLRSSVLAQALRMIDVCARFLYRALFQSLLRRFAQSIAANSKNAKNRR